MTLSLSPQIAAAIIRHARADAPHECVGLLFGLTIDDDYQATRRVPVPNAASDPQRHYLAEPEALLSALKDADARGDDLVAIYHSHPGGVPHPSDTDRADARYDVPYLITVPESGETRGFWLRGEVRPVEVVLAAL